MREVQGALGKLVLGLTKFAQTLKQPIFASLFLDERRIPCRYFRIATPIRVHYFNLSGEKYRAEAVGTLSSGE